MSFDTLGLAPALLSAVQKAGFTEPTPVQDAAIPKALAGQDLMVSSQTGSGKTAAFMLPALNRITNMPANKGTGVQVLVLTPTRELAMQVTEATRSYGAHLKDLRTATVVGGMPYGAQLKALSRRVDVLVATPGRLIDHLQAKRVDLSSVHTLVLDEADRMLDMGFIEDIETIVASTPASRQTLLFSATLDGTIARLAGKMMRNPVQIEVSGHRKQHTNIKQTLLYADDNSHKMRLLDHLLRDTNLDQAIVFTATKRGADDLADRLSEGGFSAAALHGDMNQRQRTRTLGLLQKRRLQILVATDVAARGIDVQGISHAINYDLPMQPEDYTHRIGRTGRAGNSGLAFTLANHSERHKIRRIEHYIGQPIPPETIEGLEPKKTARATYSDRKGGDGKRYGGKPGYGGNKPAYARKPTGDRRDFGANKGGYAGRGDDRPSAHAGNGESRPNGNGYAARSESRGYAGRSEERGGYKGPTERASFGDRTARRERPAGDRPAFGKKPAYNDRASNGDRPSYAGRGDFAGKSTAAQPAARPVARPRPAGPRVGFAGKTSDNQGANAPRRPEFATAE